VSSDARTPVTSTYLDNVGNALSAASEGDEASARAIVKRSASVDVPRIHRESRVSTTAIDVIIQPGTGALPWTYLTTCGSERIPLS